MIKTDNLMSTKISAFHKVPLFGHAEVTAAPLLPSLLPPGVEEQHLRETTYT